MDQEAIIRYVTETFTGVDVLRPDDGPGAGDTFFYYDPQRNRDPARSLPFATIVTKNYTGFDESSQLDRADVFRLNIGVGRETFIALFGHPPGADGSGSGTNTPSGGDRPAVDFAALDRLMPHPTYATQGWVCVLNPGPETCESVKPLLAEAHSRAKKQLEAKAAR